MAKLKLVIFDWDGTLFDSVQQIVESLQFAAQEHEQVLSADDAKSIIGLGLPEVMSTLFPYTSELHAKITKSYAEHYTMFSAQHDQWFDGVATMLHDLKAAGLKLAVATGKNRRGLDRVLLQTKSMDLFDITRAASETQSKPHPQMLLEILTQTGVNCDEALMVGDTSYDLEMAQRLNMPSIGVTYGVHDSNILKQYQPIMLVNSVLDLHQALLKRVKYDT